MEKENRTFIIEWFGWIQSTGFFSFNVSIFIACQFALESDFGRSKLACEHKNFCGMKVPHRRVFYGSRVPGLEFAHYDSLCRCLNDYISWVMYNRPLTHQLKDLDSYKLFLRDSGYCPEKDYIDRISKIYNQFRASC